MLHLYTCTISCHCKCKQAWIMLRYSPHKSQAISCFFDKLIGVYRWTSLALNECWKLIRARIFVEKLGNDDEEKLSVASDLESILTYYCKCRGETYARHNGWLDILQPMIALKCSKSDLYNCVYAFLTKYIPRWVVSFSVCRKQFYLLSIFMLFCRNCPSKKISFYTENWKSWKIRSFFNPLPRCCVLKKNSPDICCTLWNERHGSDKKAFYWLLH